jgi:hypothetical protein
MKTLTPNELYALTAMTIDNNTEGVKTLITKYGVILPTNASRSDIDKAFAALLRKSKSFRNDFAALAANESDNSENFSNFMEFLGFGKSKLNPQPEIDVQGKGIGKDPIPVKNPLPNTSTKGTGSLREAFDADTIKNIINTGLGIWAARSGTTASTTNDLQTGRETLGLQGQNQPTRGIGTTGIVLISVGAIAAIGVLIYYLSKNK